MLTEKQRLFVEAMVACGGRNASECARIAGYSPNGARKTAYELLQKPEIIQALVAHTKADGGAYLPGIMKSLLTMALDPTHKSSAHVDLQILSMFGLSPISKTESKRTVEHVPNLGALEELKLLAAQLRGLPAPKMIDATPEEDEEWSAYG